MSSRKYASRSLARQNSTGSADPSPRKSIRRRSCWTARVMSPLSAALIAARYASLPRPIPLSFSGSGTRSHSASAWL